MVIWFVWIIRGEFLSHENTLEGCTETHKSSFFPYRQVSGRNGDHEWLRMADAFISFDLVWKVQKSHAANREGSLNLLLIFSIHCNNYVYSHTYTTATDISIWFLLNDGLPVPFRMTNYTSHLEKHITLRITDNSSLVTLNIMYDLHNVINLSVDMSHVLVLSYYLVNNKICLKHNDNSSLLESQIRSQPILA